MSPVNLMYTKFFHALREDGHCCAWVERLTLVAWDGDLWVGLLSKVF